MIAAVIETLELRREGQDLIADVERTEITTPNAQIRLSWNATKRPHGFKQVGGGVAYIQSEGEFQVSHYTSQPDVLDGDHFAWRDTAHAERMILIVLLPEGAGINTESLLPRPQRAKTFNGRLAVYWELSPTEHDVAWQMSASSASAIEAAVRAINRGAVKQRSVEHAPSPDARTASVKPKTSESDAKPPKSVARWVAGVVAVCSGAATVYGLFADKRIAIFAFIGMVFALVLLVVVHRAIRAINTSKAGFYDILVKTLIAFMVLYFMALASVLFPHIVFWLTAEQKNGTSSPASTSSQTLPASATAQPTSTPEPNDGLGKKADDSTFQNWQQEVLQINSNSVVYINVQRTLENGTIEQSSGTGFIVHTDGYLITCDHLIPKAGEYRLIDVTGSVGGRYEHQYPIQIVEREEQHDLILLKLPSAAHHWDSVQSAAKGQVGSQILVLGFPLDLDLVAVSGTITSTAGGSGTWLTDAGLNHGMSGSPVFDHSGRVVAIVRGRREGAQLVSDLIPISSAKNLFQKIDAQIFP